MSSVPSAPPETLPAFDHTLRTRLVFGQGSVERVGELARELKGDCVLLVTDPGIMKAGHGERVAEILKAHGLSVVLFPDAQQNPTTTCVDRCLEVARPARIDLIIGLGGGSSMDTAKGCNFLLTNGGEMRDYWGVGKANRPMLPMIAIPTTAGTGSECQSFALISHAESHVKMACGDVKATPRVAILDPELTMSQPRLITALTGMDAISHAVETAVTARRTPLSLMYSHRAFQMTVGHYARVLAEPEDLEARGWMLFGAALAGLAIENSMLGAAHAMANPLTARFEVVHGEAVGMALPQVVRFNAAVPACNALYREMLTAAGLGVFAASAALSSGAGEQLAAHLEKLLELSGLAASFRSRNISPSVVPELAAEAAEQWTARFNPRPLQTEDFQTLYSRLLENAGEF